MGLTTLWSEQTLDGFTLSAIEITEPGQGRETRYEVQHEECGELSHFGTEQAARDAQRWHVCWGGAR